MKALAVVVAVLFALWLVGRIGAREAGSPVGGGIAPRAVVVNVDGATTAVSAEAATQHRP